MTPCVSTYNFTTKKYIKEYNLSSEQKREVTCKKPAVYITQGIFSREYFPFCEEHYQHDKADVMYISMATHLFPFGRYYKDWSIFT